MTTQKEKVFKYINTVLLSIMTLLLSYGVEQISTVKKQQQELLISTSISNTTLKNHLDDATNWKSRIEVNENKINLTMTRLEIEKEINILDKEIKELRTKLN